MLSNHLSDQELLSFYIKGKESCLQALVLRYKNPLFHFIKKRVNNHQLAEDIFQETFIKVIISLKKNGYSEQGKFLSWVMRIARNLIVDYYRGKKKLSLINNSDDYNIFDRLILKDSNVEDTIMQNQIDSDMMKVLKLLPKEQCDIIQLRFFKNMSFKEISKKRGISINTALGRMRYAITNMRKIVKERGVTLTLS